MSVKMNLEPILKLGSVIDTFVLKQWAGRYRAFAKKRFSVFSRGGGDWAPLKPATIKARRKGKGKSKLSTRGGVAILIDTDTLWNALDFRFTSRPGQFEKILRGSGKFTGIRVGFGGPAKHPSGNVTVAGLATIHQEGLGRVPARKIIVEPDFKTLNGMADDVERRWNKIAKGR